MDIVFVLGATLLWAIMVLLVRGCERLEVLTRGKS